MEKQYEIKMVLPQKGRIDLRAFVVLLSTWQVLFAFPFSCFWCLFSLCSYFFLCDVSDADETFLGFCFCHGENVYLSDRDLGFCSDFCCGDVIGVSLICLCFFRDDVKSL